MISGFQHLQPGVIINNTIGKCLLQSFAWRANCKIKNSHFFDQNIFHNFPGDVESKTEIENSSFENKIGLGVGCFAFCKIGETFTESVLQDKPLNAKYVRFSYKHKPFKLELYTGNPNINDNLIEFVNNKIITVSNNIKIK